MVVDHQKEEEYKLNKKEEIALAMVNKYSQGEGTFLSPEWK